MSIELWENGETRIGITIYNEQYRVVLSVGSQTVASSKHKTLKSAQKKVQGRINDFSEVGGAGEFVQIV